MPKFVLYQNPFWNYKAVKPAKWYHRFSDNIVSRGEFRSYGAALDHYINTVGCNMGIFHQIDLDYLKARAKLQRYRAEGVY